MRKIINIYYSMVVILPSLFIIGLFIFLCIFSCGDEEPKSSYLLTVDGYKDNFIGYYKIDGTYVENFVGVEKHESYYYYETILNRFKSVKIFAFKDSEKCSLTISIWKDDLEVVSISSGENDGYDEFTGTYKLAIGPLYYEEEITVIENPEEETESN